MSSVPPQERQNTPAPQQGRKCVRWSVPACFALPHIHTVTYLCMNSSESHTQAVYSIYYWTLHCKIILGKGMDGVWVCVCLCLCTFVGVCTRAGLYGSLCASVICLRADGGRAGYFWLSQLHGNFTVMENKTLIFMFALWIWLNFFTGLILICTICLKVTVVHIPDISEVQAGMWWLFLFFVKWKKTFPIR